MPPVPFLPPEQQEQFLTSSGMIGDTSLTQAEADWLHSVNFHFLMGYGRHYRNLVDKELYSGPKRFSEIKSLVDTEARFAVFLTPWIRRAECHLRALTVKHYCSTQEHGEGYLDCSKWPGKESWSRKIRSGILRDIHRHGEPYVTEHFKKRANLIETSVPRRCTKDNEETWLELVNGLPLWSVIDSFTIGTLGKFIQSCGDQPGGSERISKLIARELGITHRNFGVTVESFGITRNLIFHHQRLWMRPMPKSPGIPNDLKRRYSDFDFGLTYKQAHFIALANISRLLPQSEREQYLNELDTFMNENELYALGIMQPPFLKFTPPRKDYGLRREH